MQHPEHQQRPKIWQGLASRVNPTEGTKVTGQNTGRVIGYVMQDGTCGSLCVRRGKHEMT